MLFFDDFRQAEVCNAQVAFRVDQNVLGLQVTVYNALIMHVLESEDDLRSVKLRPLLVERALTHSVQMEKEFSAVYKLHDHIQESLILERELHLHYEGMIESCQNVSLSYNKGHKCLEKGRIILLTFDAFVRGCVENQLFLNHFHCVNRMARLVLH